jgi:hypothetical protein
MNFFISQSISRHFSKLFLNSLSRSTNQISNVMSISHLIVVVVCMCVGCISGQNGTATQNHCTFAGNTAIRCYGDSELTGCNFYAKMRTTGWIALGFGKTNSTIGGDIAFGYLSNVVLPTNSRTAFVNASIDTTTFQEIGVLTMYITLNRSRLYGSSTFVFLAINSKSWTRLDISDNDQLHIKQVDIFNQVDCTIAQPDVIEALHVAPNVLFLLAYILLFILWVCFRNKQPLKSRGFVPMVSLLSLYSISSSQLFFQGADLEWRWNYYCYIEAILNLSMSQTVYLLSVINYARFVMIQSMNDRKVGVLENRHDSKSVVLYIQISNWITSPAINFCIAMCYLLFWIVFGILLNIPFNDYGKCAFYQYDALYIAHVIVAIFIFLIMLSCQLLDIVLSLMTRKFDIVHFFSTSDPYYFRIEMLNLPLLGIYFIVTTIVFLFYDITLAKMIINSIALFWLLFIQYTFALIVTISKWLFSFCVGEEDENQQELVTCLRSKKVRPWFIQFAKNEWSLENVFAWDEIDKYQRSTDDVERKEIAEYFYYTFLARNAAFEINVDAKSVSEFQDKLRRGRADEQLFENILPTIYMNLNDTYFRFKVTDQKYGTFLQRKESMISSHKEMKKFEELQEIKTEIII